MKSLKIVYGLIVTGTLAWTLVGCNSGPVTPPSGAAPSADVKALLTTEPEGAKSVIDVRRDAGDGQEVVVIGRIGGSVDPWIKDRAGFQIVDQKFKPCNERADDACETPWDYCCDPQDELRKGMALIKVVDAEGKTVPVDARKLLGVKELQTVVVKGTARREGGNLTVLASGIYLRP